MINFEERLKKLKDRCQGTFRRAIFDSSLTEQQKRITFSKKEDVRVKELFETLKESAGIKYAIGAMSPVDKKSTEIYIREGNRVADSLISKLTSVRHNKAAFVKN